MGTLVRPGSSFFSTKLGHFTNANSFVADHTGNKEKDAQAEKNNDKLIHQNCKATLKNAGNAP
jgi:hypothetical protein